MSNTVRDALAELVALEDEHKLHSARWQQAPNINALQDNWRSWRERKAAALDAARAALAQSEAQPTVKKSLTVQQEAQPVAWMWQHCETGRTGFIEHHEYDTEWKVCNPRLRIVGPLYASPQQAQPVPEPLSDEQIKRAVGASDEFWATSKTWIVWVAAPSSGASHE